MKSNFVFYSALLGLLAVSCSEENVEKKVFEPTCEITSPEDGASFEMEDEVVISGKGSIEEGSIVKTVLRINNEVVGDVNAVPFDYTLAEPYKKEGKLEVILDVTADNNETASDTVIIEFLGKFREFTDTRDNKTYKTVKIGEQLWFAENLAYLPSVNKPSESSNDEARYYVFGYDGNDVNEAKASEYYNKLGVLYNWVASGGDKESDSELVPSGIQGPCPDGWHMPSKAEWEILFNYVRERIPDEEAVEGWDGSFQKNVNGHLRAENIWPVPFYGDFETYPQLQDGGFDTYGFGVIISGVVVGGGFYYGPTGEDANLPRANFWTPNYDAITYPSSPGGISVDISNSSYEPSVSKGSSVLRGHSIRCVKN